MDALVVRERTIQERAKLPEYHNLHLLQPAPLLLGFRAATVLLFHAGYVIGGASSCGFDPDDCSR